MYTADCPYCGFELSNGKSRKYWLTLIASEHEHIKVAELEHCPRCDFYPLYSNR